MIKLRFYYAFDGVIYNETLSFKNSDIELPEHKLGKMVLKGIKEKHNKNHGKPAIKKMSDINVSNILHEKAGKHQLKISI